MKNFFTVGITLFLFLSHTYGQNGGLKLSKKEIKLNIDYPSSAVGDTLILLYTSDINKVIRDPSMLTWNKIKAPRQVNGEFSFVIKNDIRKTSTYTYVFLSKLLKTNERSSNSLNDFGANLLPNYVFKNGDEIKMVVKELGGVINTRGYRHNFSYKFFGHGAHFQNLYYKVDSLSYYGINPNSFLNHQKYNPFNYENIIAERITRFLDKYKMILTRSDYYELLAHGIFSAKADEAMLIRHVDKSIYEKYDRPEQDVFLHDYNKIFCLQALKVPLQFRNNSVDYVQASFNKMELTAAIQYPFHYADSLYNFIKKRNLGLTRERLLIVYFSKYKYQVREIAFQLEDAIKNFQRDDLYKYLTTSQKIHSGTYSIDFNLEDVKGRTIKLSDFKGKVIFLDFWYTGCGNCLLYYKNVLSKVEEKFSKDSDVVFLTVSIDKNKTLWTNSVQSGKYTSPNVINLYTKGEGQNSDVIKFYNVQAYPQPILIGKDQTIKVCDESLRNERELEKAIIKEKLN